MARINAGSTLVNQYAPPFVVSDSITDGWTLQWNETLKAFEAIDPNANVVVSGFDAINFAIFPNVTQQVFVVDFVPDSTLTTAQKEASFIITINGVKQQDGSYTLIDDQASGTTVVTLSETVANETVEILGLKTSSGAGIYRYNAIGDGTNTVHALPWLAPSDASLIVTIDGIKQQVDSYSAVPNSTYTGTTLTLSEAPGFNLSTITAVADGGTNYIAGDVLTILGGTLRTQKTGVPEVIGPAQLIVNTVAGGVITEVTITDPGDYTSDTPTGTVFVSGGSGSVQSNATTLAFATNQITRTGGTGFVTLGFAIDQDIIVYDANTPANEGVAAVIQNVTENTITTTASVFTADASDPTAIVYHSATFTIGANDYVGENLEVVGLVIAGETPASPVQVVNLEAAEYPGVVSDAGTAFSDNVRVELFKDRRLSGDAQLFDFRDLVTSANSGVNLKYSANGSSIYIEADVPTFDTVGTGQTILKNEAVTNPLQFYALAGGQRTSISLAADTLTWDYDPGYVAISTGTNPYVQTAGQRIIGINGLAAAFGITLLDPATLTLGDTVTIKNQSNNTSIITLSAAGNRLIDGSLTKAFSGAWSYITLCVGDDIGTRGYYTIAEG